MINVQNNKTLVSALELKRLLVELKDKRNDICIRYRLIGEMWKPNFLRIVAVTEDGALLCDEIANKMIALRNLFSVMQFEIDSRFQAFEPNFHYEVTPHG